MAGKKVKGATVTIKVTDGDSLKDIARKAKAAGAGLNETKKSAGDVRRNMQAMSGRTESASKSFSRMQQGTGGLVQSYAVLASTLFAITAAFRALEQAQNIQAQIRGFEELTKITGTSMLTITNSVREATAGLLDFQTAAQQTAIATAAGFSADQITGLAEGAKNASVALGRDLTDSFNRLIRGVTKAEPELLDELGVILRLDIATRNYAASIGASADKLTIAQRRTAVYNEVNKQLEDNFGSIAEKADDLVNPISKFQTQLLDIGIALSETILPVFTGIIDFLSRNQGILFGFLTIFAVRLTNDVLPGISTLGSRMEESVRRSKTSLKDLNKNLSSNAKAYNKLGKSKQSTDKIVSKAFKQSLAKRGMDEKKFFQKSDANQKRSISAHINALKKQEKATGKSMQRQIAIQRAAYAKIEANAKRTGTKVGLSLEAGLLRGQRGLIKLEIKAKQVFASIGASAMKLAPIFGALGAMMNAVFGIFMAVSFAMIFIDMIPAVQRSKEATQELKEEAEKSGKAFLELNSAIGALNDTKLDRVAKAFESESMIDRLIAVEKAVSHLSNTLNNFDVGNMGDNLIEKVEKNLVDGGFEEKHEFRQGGAAKAAGKVAAADFASGFSQALLIDRTATEEAIRKFVTRLTLEGGQGGGGYGTLRPGQAADLGILEGNEDLFDNEKGGIYGGSTIGNKAVSNAKKFVPELMKIIDELNSGTLKTKEIELRMERLQEILGSFGGGNFSKGSISGAFFERIFDQDGEFIGVRLRSSFEELFNDFDTIVKPAKTAVESITDLDEPIDNFMEQIKLSLPKPSEAQKIASAVQSIQTQIDAARSDETKGQQTIIMDLLDAKEKELSIDRELITLDDVAIFKLETRLKISKELATILVEQNKERKSGMDILIETNEALANMELVDKARNNLHKVEMNFMKQLNDRHTKRLMISMEIEKIEDDITVLQGKIANNSLNIGIEGSNNLAVNQALTQEQITQKEVLEGQLTILENQLDRFFEVRKLMVETFDKFGGDALTSIIEGGSGSEAFAKMAGGIKKESAKMLSDTIMTPVVGKFKGLLGMDKEEIVELTPEAKAIQKVHNDHVDRLEQALIAHAKAFDKNMVTGDDTLDGLMKKVLGGTSESSPVTAITDSITEEVSTGFMAAFKGIGGGGGISGFFSTLFGGLFGMADGGVIGLAKGGIARYAHGGIAKQPTYLVGEGKQNEAVVPLPDNKSIPVDLGGGAGNTNNTSITVNIDDTGADTSVDSDGGRQFADAINMAVQAEIEKQMRPGGILAG